MNIMSLVQKSCSVLILSLSAVAILPANAQGSSAVILSEQGVTMLPVSEFIIEFGTPMGAPYYPYEPYYPNAPYYPYGEYYYPYYPYYHGDADDYYHHPSNYYHPHYYNNGYHHNGHMYYGNSMHHHHHHD